ncbi:MAG: hypothetical protein LBG80_20810 [Bacteroidales bacterium]|jgi:hypothetical protein|nr:hypothetical protein [Bacteroidales bacterium]
MKSLNIKLLARRINLFKNFKTDGSMGYNRAKFKMKNILFIITVLVLAIAFPACKKEGVYHPKKKIARIYCQDYGEVKELQEVWTWDDKNLSKITAGDNSYYWDFQYNDKDQIEKITFSEGDYYAFSYDKRLIKKIDLYTFDGALVETYEFEHTKKKITTITNTFYGYKSLSLADQCKATALRCFLPEPVTENLFSKHKNHISTRKNTPAFVDVYEYTWDGDNIKSIFYTSNGDVYYTLEFSYEYDKKNNPYYYSFIPNEITSPVTDAEYYLTCSPLRSKNNVTYEKGNDNEGMSFETNYEIVYDGKFPTEIGITTNYAGDNTNYIATYFYVYN